MSIFKKQETAPQRNRENPGSFPRGAQSGDGAISIIAAGMKIVGDIWTEGTVRVEGTVTGTIRAGNSIVLGQAGVIEGDLFTADAIIGGRVAGSIVATNRLELQGTSIVEGAIQTRAEHLKLEEGSRFEGQVHMVDGSAPPAADPPEAIPSTAAVAALTTSPSAEAHNGWSNGGAANPARDNGQAVGLVEEKSEPETPLLL